MSQKLDYDALRAEWGAFFGLMSNVRGAGTTAGRCCRGTLLWLPL